MYKLVDKQTRENCGSLPGLDGAQMHKERLEKRNPDREYEIVKDFTDRLIDLEVRIPVSQRPFSTYKLHSMFANYLKKIYGLTDFTYEVFVKCTHVHETEFVFKASSPYEVQSDKSIAVPQESIIDIDTVRLLAYRCETVLNLLDTDKTVCYYDLYGNKKEGRVLDVSDMNVGILNEDNKIEVVHVIQVSY